MGKSTLVLPVGTRSLGIPDELYLCGWACFFPNSSNYNWVIYVLQYVYIYIRVHDWWVWVKYPNFRMVSDNDHDVNIDNTVWWSFPALGCENPTYGESVYMIIFLYFCENWISREEKLTNLYTANWILILMVISLPAEKIIRSIKRSLKSLKKS